MTKISFCGISGNGVSALAQIMVKKGFEVRGSDRTFDLGGDQSRKKALEEIGIRIFPQDGSGITDDLDTLYVSTAIEDSIADVRVAKEKNIAIKTRPDLLAELFHQYKHNIAISGTSGKTTTTAMIGYILDTLGKKPCMINGGYLRNYENQKGVANIIYNEGDICVIEADESNGTIEKYHPYIGLINNIGVDHKSLDELIGLFKDFAGRCKEGLVVNIDFDNCKNITNPNGKTVTFSLKDSNADFYADNIKPIPDGTQYNLDGKTFKLNLIGKFNVSNALAAIAVCSLLGIDKFEAAETLEGFLGTQRRLEVVGTKNGITLIDDFAHNPDKVAASVSALKDYKGRLIVMFQPHGFAPMKLTGKDIVKAFAAHLDKEDILILPDIYFVGGTADKTISSKDLINQALELGVNAHYIPERKDVEKFILANAASGDRVIIMGARDNTLPDFSRQLLKEI